MISVVDRLVIRDMHFVSWLIVGFDFRVIGFFILGDHANVTMLCDLIPIIIAKFIDNGNEYVTVIVIDIIVVFVIIIVIGNVNVIVNFTINLIVFLIQ
jgi:hypothetical protein